MSCTEMRFAVLIVLQTNEDIMMNWLHRVKEFEREDVMCTYALHYKGSESFIVYASASQPVCCSTQLCARAVEMCRDRMLEIKSFQLEVSLKFSTVVENVRFPKFSHGTLLPLHHNIIIWSLNRSSVIILEDLFRLSLYGCCLNPLDRHDLPKSWTTIGPNCPTLSLCLCWSWARYYRTFLSLCLFYLISKTSHNKLFFPKFKCIWQKLGQRAILSPTGFLLPT